jgi:hypothetical protein
MMNDDLELGKSVKFTIPLPAPAAVVIVVIPLPTLCRCRIKGRSKDTTQENRPAIYNEGSGAARFSIVISKKIKRVVKSRRTIMYNIYKGILG